MTNINCNKSTIQRLPINQLTINPELSPRHRLDAITISRYTNAVRAERKMPPVKVVKVQGVLILADGAHRIAAYEALGLTVVEAEVTEGTLEDAQWAAIKSNLEHGLALRPSEVRRAFGLYIKSGQHQLGRGKRKSYREIGMELGRPHTTIRGWMHKDFPRLFAKYAEKNEFKGEGGLVDKLQPTGDAKTGLEKIKEFQRVYRNTTCPDAKEVMTTAFEQLAKDILGWNWQEAQSDY